MRPSSAPSWSWPALLVLGALARSPTVAVDGKVCPSGPSSRGKDDFMTGERQLRRDILCPYDKTAGPTKSPSANTTLTFQLLRTRMEVDDYATTLTVYGFTLISWKDERLLWDPAAYGNVTYTYVDWETIWTPTIAHLEFPTTNMQPTYVLVAQGDVYWMLLAPLVAPCISAPSDWPYDSMRCNLTIVNHSHQDVNFRDEVHFSFFGAPSKPYSYVSGTSSSWRLDSIGLEKFTSPMHVDGITISFNMKRASASLEATVVVPCVVLGVLAVLSLALPAVSALRPLLLCAVIVVQVFVSLWNASSVQVLVRGDRPPRVLLLYRDCLFLSGAAVLQWLAVRWLRLAEANQATPRLLTPVVRLLTTPTGVRLSRIATLGEHKSTSLALLADRLGFLVIAVLFTGLCCRLAY